MSESLSGIQWRDQHVLVTGVCGAVGRELLRELRDLGATVVGVDQDESAVFLLNEEYRGCTRTRAFVADIRNSDGLTPHLFGVDTIFHTAALKHVGGCEHAPREAIRTNLLGTMNVIDAAVVAGASRVVLASTDKAVRPTNVMGATKLIAERLMTAANAQYGASHTTFVSVRFGNVLGSRGSVVPLFRAQVAGGGPVTLTDPRMTRFVMTQRDAARAMIDAASLARGGEVFVPKMVSLRIEDLSAVLTESVAREVGLNPEKIDVEVRGRRPGERLAERMLSEEEVGRAHETDQYLVIAPLLGEADTDRGDPPRPSWSGDSEVATLTREDVATYLRDAGLITS